jgi:hypothetical protein
VTTGAPGHRAWWSAALGVLLTVAAAKSATAQVFFGARPEPPFTIGPLMIRAKVTEGASAANVHVLWSLVVSARERSGDVAQDLFLLWPGELVPDPALGPADAALASYVEERGFSVVGDGRAALSAQRLTDGERSSAEAQPGGAPFVVFVLQDHALGLSPPATLIRIPWTSRLTDRGWLMNLSLAVGSFVKPQKATWAERLFLGERSRVTMSFNEVRDRQMFPLYFDNRDRVVRLADAPAELVVSFDHADRLKIDELAPPTSLRRTSETEETTEVVSLFLDNTDGIVPQRLSVQFGYVSRVHAWTLVLIPTLFFALGQAVGPLEKIVPGKTTRDEVLARCGPAVEQQEQFPAADRRTLVYRGQRLVPKTDRRWGWVSTVGHWESEAHEVKIDLVADVVQDVKAQVRYARHATQPTD